MSNAERMLPFDVSRKTVVIALPVLLLAALVAGGAWYLTGDDDDGASEAADAFARSWSEDKLDSVLYASSSGADVSKAYKEKIGALDGTPVAVSAEKVRSKRAELHVSWDLGSARWTYDTSVGLKKSDQGWRVVWEPAVVHPDLTNDTTLVANRSQAPRADVLGDSGQVLVTQRPVVEVGLAPNRMSDVAAEVQQVAKVVGVDAGPLEAQVKSAKPDAFVSVITLRRDDYDAKKPALQAISGTVFRESTLPLAPTREFASALLGRVGPVTAEKVEASNGLYKAGDIAGLSGIQQQYDERLAGKPGTSIDLKGPDGNSRRLFEAAPVAGSPVRTSIDEKTQRAADAAIAGASKPTSFVAMRASTGEVLAVSNGPEVGAANRAFVGQYPPGSAFKVISTYALLQKGVTADQTVECPPTLTVDGKQFKNAEDESFASAPFRLDFAHSCNTAFVSLAPVVPGNALPDAATEFGIGKEWKAGVPVYSGSVPAPSTKVDLAATVFGQGKVLASPLAMANVAAGVASSTARTPKVVLEPAPGPSDDTALDLGAIEKLRPLMREVVVDGTGTAVKGVKGEDVFGKTGTAEFGTADPPQSHAWFMGYQGDIAFAAFVEGGEFGGDSAAPLAARFLNNLAG